MSIEKIECYGYIVGLYNGDCQCYDGKPGDYDESDSGLYISDLLELKFIDALLNCEQGASVWEMMEKARNYAIRIFIGDTNALLLKENKLKRKPFYGGLGRSVFTKDHSLVAGRYAGVRLFCADVVSGYLKLKGVGTVFNTTGTLEVKLYNTLGTVLANWNLDTQANAHKENALGTPLTLPLHDKYLDNVEYFLLYQVGGSQPKNNDLVCSCEKWLPRFNKNIPYFQSHSSRVKGWQRYLMVGGYYDPSLPTWGDTAALGSNYMYGLTLDVELACKVGEVFCKDQLDYDGNTLAQAMALAIQRQAVVHFIDLLLGTPNLSRLVAMDKEELLRKKQELEGSYMTMVEYIASNVNIQNNDCFECKDIIGLIKTGIMA